MEKLTPLQALARIRHYCAYQERCHKEVKDKLMGYGLNRREADDIIANLINDNFLNEQRFAIQFAGGKFRAKKWGRQKIERELRRRKVSEYCIRKAMTEIDDEDYGQAFRKLAEKKRLSLKSEKNIFIRKRKIRDFLLSRGYESEMIYRYLDENA